MSDLSITAIQKQTRPKMTSRTEASLTAPQVVSTKDSEMLAQLKQEIREAEYAFTLMQELEGRLKAAYQKLDG